MCASSERHLFTKVITVLIQDVCKCLTHITHAYMIASAQLQWVCNSLVCK
jgi:hypothetical protein